MGVLQGVEYFGGTETGVELRLIYSAERISATISRLAATISADYGADPLLLIVVLKGALFFAADLARQIRCPLVMDFVKLASYSGMESTGKVTITKGWEMTVADRNVLVVEDIIDTGLSLAFLLERLQAASPRSIKVCTLIDKKGHRKVEIVPDYAGIVCEDGFLVGYGLDLDDQFRQLPAIYEVIR